MIWNGTHLSIQSLAVDSAYQSRNQAMKSRELSIHLQDWIMARHKSGEGYKKKFGSTEDPENHCGVHYLEMEEVYTLPRSGCPTN